MAEVAPWEEFGKAGAAQPPWGQSSPSPQGSRPAEQKTSDGGAGEGGSALGALFRGFLTGAGDMIHGGAQIGARMGPEIGDMGRTSPQQQQGLVGRVDQAAQQREQAFQAAPATAAHPIASGIGRAGGQMAATAPLAMATGGASIPARLGMGAAMGAIGGAVQPVIGDDYWTQKAKQAGTGAGVGGALGTAGRLIGPPLSQAASTAIDNFPHIASLVRGSAMRSPDNFNRAAVSQALDPIGIVAPKNLKAGHDLINFASDRLTDAYNKVLPKLSLTVDHDLANEIQALKTYSGQMAEDKHNQLVKFIDTHVEAPIAAKGGTLDGVTIKKIQSQLSSKAGSYSASADADQRELGGALHAVREAVMDAAARQNPAAATELKRVNQAYAMFSRVRAAANRRADSEGIFTPQDLLAAARAGDKSAGKGSFAKGDAAMQGVAEAARGPMSTPKVSQMLKEALGGGVVGEAAGMMHGMPGLGAAGAAVPLAARGAYRASQTPAARVAGQAVSAAAPGAGSVAARMKASRRVGEIQTQLYSAKRKGDIDEVQKLTRELAGAQSDYQALRPRQ